MQAVSVILVRPRFPENIGMAARACANMGVRDLILVEPARWEKGKALSLATSQGAALLETIQIAPSLKEALLPFSRAYGTTARTGGWRQGVLSPRKAAEEIAMLPASSDRIALVFGPEDRGLENTEVKLCTGLITIPTAPAASSLNLAQAVLLVLYECVTASMPHSFHWHKRLRGKGSSRPATLAEQETLFAAWWELLLDIDFFPVNNSHWFMLPLRRFFHRAVLQRHEFDLFMGICRQMRRATKRTRKETPTQD